MATVDINFQLRVLTDILALLRPVRDMIGSLDGPRRLLGSLGWDLDAIPGFPFGQLDTKLTVFSDSYDQLHAKLDPPPATFEDLDVLLKASVRAVDAVADIGSIFSGLSLPGLSDVGAELVNLLAVRFLSGLHPTLYQLFILLTIIQQKDVVPIVDEARGEFVRFPVIIPELRLPHLVDLIRDPAGILKIEYGLSGGLTDAAVTADKLFPRVAAILQTLNVNAVFGVPASIGVKFGPIGHDLARHMLTVFQRVASAPSTNFGFGATFSLDVDIGLVVRPFGTLNFQSTLADWAIAVEADVGVEGFGVSSTDVIFPSALPIQAADVKVAAAKIPAPAQVSDNGAGPAFLLGTTDGTRLEIGEFQVIGSAALHPGAVDYGASVEIRRASLVLSSGDGDGFLSQVLPSETRIDFDFGVAWSRLQGLRFRASGSLELSLAVNVAIAGVIEIEAIQIGIRPQGQDLSIVTSANARTHIGPVDAVAEKVGLAATLKFPDRGGNLGPLNASLGFKAPEGIGISINAGPVSGGGFISFKDGRYSGVLELKVYEVRVSAFGVIDTKLPDGSRGFSFVIVISAEFTPIQLGFGFTLLGVGGVLGINRAIDEKGLRQALLQGSLENVLFPHNVTQRAPEIIDTLTTIMPPAEGKFLFGPMAKIGWGSPTLIRAEIGVMLELPGPLVTILGELHCQLPKPERALVDLNLSVTGRIDFPQKLLEIDARLRDSKIGGYTVGGQMAMRLRWGQQPSFALAIGGFHPSFQPPAGFPALQPLEVDLGRNGNPSIQLSGFFALTSNTVQVGGALTLHASGSGISLDAIIAVKAIFVFSPFSFEAQIYAKVKISFHGRGPSVQLHGALSGPSPWRIRAKVCVSILWWDACLGFNKSFGGEEQIEEQTIDPWDGDPPEIPRLKPTLEDPRSWTPLPPPGAFQVVSLAEAPPQAPESHPFDPMGLAQVRQRVVPLEGTHTKITRFGPAKSSGPERFNLTQARLETAGGSVDVTFAADVLDFFAPAQYFDLDEAKKLSAPSFQEFVAGYTLTTDTDDAVVGSSSDGKDTTFNTFVRDSRPSPPPPPVNTDYHLLLDRLTGQSKRALVELVGLRREGTTRYIESDMRSPFGVREPRFTVTQKSDLSAIVGMQPTSQWDAIFAAGAHVSMNAALTGFLQVTPLHEIGGP